jgi:hypothetical protein
MEPPRPEGYQWLVVVLALAGGCSRSTEATVRPVRTGSAASPTELEGIDAGLEASSADAAESKAMLSNSNAVLARITAWNLAIDRHDVAALADLYGHELCFYGQRWTKERVLAFKERTLSADSSFHQQIVDSVAISKSGYSAIATFVKRSGPRDKVREVRARLLLKNFAGDYGRPDAPWTIVGENDDVERLASSTIPKCESEAENSARNIPDVDARCEHEASKVFIRLPEIKTIQAELQQEYDARIGSEPDLSMRRIRPRSGGNRSSFIVDIGLDTPNSVNVMAGYSVDRALGTFDAWSQFGDHVHVDEADLRKIEAACKQ